MENCVRKTSVRFDFVSFERATHVAKIHDTQLAFNESSLKFRKAFVIYLMVNSSLQTQL